MQLVTVGTVAFDDIETPRGRAAKAIGGAATYISRAASYFIREQGVVSVVGGDFPSEELADMEASGINIEGIEIRPREKSFFWAGRYHNNMNNRDTLITDLNVLADFNPILPESYRSAPYLMLGNLTPEIQMNVLRQMHTKPRIVALDTMNFWMDIALDSLLEVLREIDILMINEEEARQLSGEYSLLRAARLIHEMGPEYLVIKRGEHGAFLFHQEEIFSIPALPVEEVMDPTGAGDSFAGGFMGYLSAGDDLSFDNFKRAMVYASVMGSFCVEEFSLGKLKSLTNAEIRHRAAQFVELTQFRM